MRLEINVFHRHVIQLKNCKNNIAITITRMDVGNRMKNQASKNKKIKN